MSKDADSPLPNDLPNDLVTALALLVQERQLRLQESALHEQTVAELASTIETQQQLIAQQEHRLAQLLRRHFGPSRESIDPDQLLLFEAADLEALVQEYRATADGQPLEEQAAAPEQPADESAQPGHGRRVLPTHLPREERRYELTLDEQRCPGCNQPRTEIGTETSSQLEYVPATYKVIEHVRVKYACRHCAEQVAVAPKPPQPAGKGLPGPGLLAHTVLSKYGDHLPLYRQEDQAARQGLELRRSTLCDWIAAAADLAVPLVQRMRELVLQSRVIHTDDTTVKLLVPLLGRAKIARFWAYIGDRQQPYTVYDFTDSRNRDGPAKFLQGFSGYLQADAYGGYDGLYASPSSRIIEVACWAHARRYWFEAATTDPARAHHVLGIIARLYQIESACENLTDSQRCTARQTQALPLLRSLETWLAQESPRLLPKSPIGKAASYTTNQWQALVRYTEDGELSIDNNVSERTVKMQAIGRRNWLFVASVTGGQRAAALYSLIASCKANQVEPWAYLRDVFTQLPALPAEEPERLDQLLPDRWLQAHPQHRWNIDEIRRKERKKRHQKLRQRRKK